MASQASQASPNMMQKLLTVPEAAAFLHVSTSTVYRYVSKGRIPYMKKGFGHRFRKSDLDEWLSKDKRVDLDFSLARTDFLTSTIAFDMSRAGGKGAMAKAKKKRLNCGFGSVYIRSTKSGKSRFYLDYRDAKGNRKQDLAKNASNWEEAILALQSVVRKEFFCSQGIKEEKEPILFEKLADMYIRDWAKNNKLGSWKTDEGRVKGMKVFFKEMFAHSITSQDIEQFKTKKREDGLKLTTINKHIQILSKLFNCGISWRYLKENPCKGVRKYPEESFRRTRVLSREEEVRLMKAVIPAHLESMLKVLLNTGLRRKELFQITWSEHVDFRIRKLLIRETKTARSRYIPMNETVYHELKELHWSRKDDGVVYRNPKTGEGFVCIRKALQGACRRAGIANLNLLDVRRTFATRIIEAGADIITVQQLLGHTSVKTTQIYTMSNQEQKRNAVALLDTVKERSCDTMVTKEKRTLVTHGFSIN